MRSFCVCRRFTVRSFSSRSMPNCVMKSKFYPRRTFLGDQIDTECPNKTSLFYQLPFQKVDFRRSTSLDAPAFPPQGYLVDWNIQKQVWDYLFGKVKRRENSLVSSSHVRADLLEKHRSVDHGALHEFEFYSRNDGSNLLRRIRSRVIRSTRS